MVKKINIIIVFIIFLIGIMQSCSKDIGDKKPDKEVVLRLEPSKKNPRNSEGDFVTLKGGSILFVYSHFTGGSGDNAFAHLAGRISYDKGKTWSDKDVTIVKNEGGMNVMSVSLLRLDNGKIALFYLRKNSETDCIPFMRISKDEGKTWEKAQRCIPDKGYHVVNNDRLLQLASGRLLFPTSIHAAPDWKYGKIYSYYSDDTGKTWHKSEMIPNPNNIVLQEPGIVPLNNGKLLLFARTDAGSQYFSFSEDSGETWSEIEKGNIKSPLSPAAIERIPSTGDLLLLWNNNYEKGRDGGKRTPYSLAISKNEGKTWEYKKTVDSDPYGWYCYTAIEFIDNDVLLAYCAGDIKTNSGLSTTQITRLSLDWIYKKATPDPFVVSDKETVLLGCDDKNAIIRYTLDGTLPSKYKGIIYKEPLKVKQISFLNMQTFADEKTPSKIVSVQIGSNLLQEAQLISSGLKQGIQYRYYEGLFNQTTEIEQINSKEQGVYPKFILGEKDRKENFAYVFNGFIKIPKDGKYTFYTKSNDGSVLYINDQLIIDNDGAHGVYSKSGSTSLKKGFHKIEVKYFQAGGGKQLNIFWRSDDFSKVEIPSTAFFYE